MRTFSQLFDKNMLKNNQINLLRQRPKSSRHVILKRHIDTISQQIKKYFSSKM